MLLRNIPLFANLGDAELAQISAEANLKQFPKNKVILSEGEKSDSLYTIVAGKVKVLISDEDGKEIILAILGSGEFFGEMSLIDNQPRSATVITMEPSSFNVISQADFIRCLTSNAQIARTILQTMAKRLREADKKIESLALLDVYGRVARTLLELAKTENGELVVSQNLSQQDIANMVGASREMVNRILKDLAQGGYIKVESKHIVINEQLPSSLSHSTA
ncbi:MAG: cyclic nucleotide-binding domain-containing protein [Burkholderiales bacterium]|nr:cyclic nucleotide-binding domain-containing protein [Burkholderiales bacterium]